MAAVCHSHTPRSANKTFPDKTQVARANRHDVQGFGQPLRAVRDWLQPGPCLTLPKDLGVNTTPAIADLSSLLNKNKSNNDFPKQIMIDRWVEALGNLEARLSEIADAMPQGSHLCLDIKHAMAPMLVRSALEGRQGNLDPIPLLQDHELQFSIPRIVHALSKVGWIVEDLAELRYWDEKLPQMTIEALLKCGIIATRYLHRVPGERLWIRARRGRPIAGSVLIAQREGQEQLVAQTRSRVEAFLPGTWEIIEAPAHSQECESWNQGVLKSSGDTCWLLRAGDAPTDHAFNKLMAVAMRRPVMCKDPDQVSRHGLAGAMFGRATLFDIGPFPRDISSDLVAGEEWVMRASASGHSFEEQELAAPWQGPGPLHGLHADKAARELLLRWEPIESLRSPGHSEARPVPTPPWVLEGRKPKLTLCMIAKDEEAFLPSCIERVLDIVDEIVLVDTGSTDKTVEIAESFGAKILHHPWEGDFSKPRNVGLAAATGDWILVLDPDELVMEDSLPLFRQLIESDRACGYHMRFMNEHEEGRTQGVTMVRLFRKLPGIYYEYEIHEQVAPSLVREAEAMNLALFPSKIEVLHYGYSSEVMEERGKYERNMAIFAKQLERDPTNVYCLYKYGDFIRQMGNDRSKVIEVFQEAYDLMLGSPPSTFREMPFTGEIAALLALEIAKDGRNKEAYSIVREGLARFLRTPNLHYVAAGLASSLGRFDDALAQFGHCLEYAGQTLVVPIQEGITGWVSYAGMAQCWIGKGDLARAEDLLLRAIADKPEWEVSHLRLSNIMLERGDPDQAIDVLMRYLNRFGEKDVVRFQGALILEHMGLWKEASQWYEAALDGENVDKAKVHMQAGAMRLLLRQTDPAREHWEALGDDPCAVACLALIDKIEGRESVQKGDNQILTEAARCVLANLRKLFEKVGARDWTVHVDEVLGAFSSNEFSKADEAQAGAWAS